MALTADLVIAFTSGLLTVLSPCGLPLLPGIIGYYFKDIETRIGGFIGGLIALLGIMAFAIPFGIAGLLFRSVLDPFLPYFELIAGIIVISLGVFILTNIKLPFIKPIIRAKHGSHLSLFVFGFAYAMAAIGCTVGIFFTVILLAASRDGFIVPSIILVVYAVSIGLPIVLLATLASEFRRVLINKLTKHANKIRIISGVFLIIVGIYLIAFFILNKLGIISVI